MKRILPQFLPLLASRVPFIARTVVVVVANNGECPIQKQPLHRFTTKGGMGTAAMAVPFLF